MNFKTVSIISFVLLSIGCASKTKAGRQLTVTREENVMSCRFIGNVSGSDAMEQAVTLDRATHLVWVGTGQKDAKVYSCD